MLCGMACAALPVIGVSDVRAANWISWSEARSRAAPKPVSTTTFLVRDGQPNAVIGVPEDPAYARVAARLQQRIRQRSGVTVPIVPGRSLVTGPAGIFTPNVSRPIPAGGRNLILFGDLTSNPAIARFYTQWYAFEDAAYPGRGGHTIRTLIDPAGLGWNAVLLGGPGPEESEAATSAYLEDLSFAPGTVSSPYVFKVKFGKHPFLKIVRSRSESVRQTLARSEFYLLDPESQAYQRAPRWVPSPGREAAVAYVCDILFFYLIYPGLHYGLTGDPELARYVGKGMDALYERMDWVEARRTASFDDHYKVEAWTRAWQQVMNCPYLTPEQRVRGHKVMAFLAGQTGMYRVDGAAYGKTRERILSRHAYSGRFAGDALCRIIQRHSALRGKLAEVIAENRASFAVLIDGMLGTYMTGFDHKWGLDGGWHLLQAAAEEPRETYLTTGMSRLTADYAAMCINNAGEFVNFGAENIGAAERYDAYQILGRAELLHRDGTYQWWLDRRMKRPPYKVFISSMNWLGHWYHTAFPAREPTHLKGLNRLPLSRPIYEDWRAGRIHSLAGKPVLNDVPFEEAFNKITFRDGLGVDDQYLLLDGLGGQVYSGNDANGICEYSRYGQPLLVQYTLRHEPYYQNTISVSKGNDSEPAGTFARLLEMADLDGLSYTQSEVSPLCGSDNIRHLFMVRGRYVIVIDDVVLHEAGEQVVACTFRGFGRPELDSREGTWRLRGDSADLFLQSLAVPGAPPPRLSSSVRSVHTGPDGSSVDVQVLRQTVGDHFEAGERFRFASLFYGMRPGDVPPFRAEPPAGEAIRVTGSEHTAVFGAPFSGRMTVGELEVTAAAFQLEEARARFIGVTRLSRGGLELFRCSRPITLVADLINGRYTFQSRESRNIRTIVWKPEWQFGVAAARAREGVELPFGERVRVDTEELPAAILSALGPGPVARALRPAPRLRPAAGALAIAAEELMPPTGKPIAARASADLDGDGLPESVCIRADGALTVFRGGGDKILETRLPVQGLISAWAGILNGEPAIICGARNGSVTCCDLRGKNLWTYRNRHFGYGSRLDVYSIAVGDANGDGGQRVILGCHGVVVLLEVTEGPEFVRSTEVYAHKVSPLALVRLDASGKQGVLCNTMAGGLVLVDPAEGVAAFGWNRRWNSTAKYLGVHSFGGDGPWVVHAGANGVGCGRLQPQAWQAGKRARDQLWGRDSWYLPTGSEVSAGTVYDWDGDGTPEIITANEAGFLVGYDHLGQELWRKLAPSPARALVLGDVTGDGRTELLAAGETPALTVFDAGREMLCEWSPPDGTGLSDMWVSGKQVLAAGRSGAVYRLTFGERASTR